jgi:hypothetical protein
MKVLSYWQAPFGLVAFADSHVDKVEISSVTAPQSDFRHLKSNGSVLLRQVHWNAQGGSQAIAGWVSQHAIGDIHNIGKTCLTQSHCGSA